MTHPTDSLRAVPLFAGVASQHLELIAAQAAPVRLQAGDSLFRAGDPGERMYVVTSGSIELLDEERSATLGAPLGPGEALGELSLLTGAPRSVSARARRDSELIAISREAFSGLLTTQPDFAVTLVGLLGERLRRATPPVPPPRPPRTIAVVPLHPGAPAHDLTDALAAQLRPFGSVHTMHDLDAASGALDRAEADNRWVLLPASADLDDPHTAYCLRQADRVVGVATEGCDPGASHAAARLRGCDIAFRAPAGVEPDLEGWVDLLDPRTCYVLRDGDATGVARMARRLSGRSVGVVLSGGGARGMAHIGVVEELQRSGVVIDRIGGTSMGGSVGSLFAEQRSADEVAEVIDATYVRDTPLRGRTIPIVALSRGVRGLEAQRRIHGDRRIEGLDISFYCVSSDLAAQRLVVHRRGLLAIAVSATQALPAFVPPLLDGERMLVDGAIFSNLPVDPMRQMAEGPVIAVDVAGRLPAPRPARSRMPFLRRWVAGPAAAWAPSITEIVLRSILLGNVAADSAARDSADLVIQPNLRGVATMRFRDLEGVRLRGREAVQELAEAGALATLASP